MSDAVSRELPGVLGNEESCENRRIAGAKVYTRPESVVHNSREYTVPEVLRSGHHQRIDDYREDTR